MTTVLQAIVLMSIFLAFRVFIAKPAAVALLRLRVAQRARSLAAMDATVRSLNDGAGERVVDTLRSLLRSVHRSANETTVYDYFVTRLFCWNGDFGSRALREVEAFQDDLTRIQNPAIKQELTNMHDETQSDVVMFWVATSIPFMVVFFVEFLVFLAMRGWRPKDAARDAAKRYDIPVREIEGISASC